MVHAGGAADAVEHLLEVRPEHRRAAIVDQHDVIGGRSIEIGRAAWAGGEGGVDRDILPGGAAGEQAQEGGAILKCGHDLFYRCKNDMDIR